MAWISALWHLSKINTGVNWALMYLMGNFVFVKLVRNMPFNLMLTILLLNGSKRTKLLIHRNQQKYLD
ncbi:unnamed protein product [Oppiella nova]|uniref:Uncharacterized protein n=1 Tax=Oppiella nova TaxID=334625 RepID=A0A7R9LU34_9ACAR|nr:unnamed protein product [Oppiella nova]CAG2167005.1 unnamed protein product [Oppiella nova]